MPIIKDGQTPEGRVVECRKGENSTSECRVRMMTPEERAYYGEAVPRDEWQKAPAFACMGEEPAEPKEKQRRFDLDYGVIECQTKEDFERANEAIKKSIPKKPEIIACDEKKRYHCSCGKTLFIKYTGGCCHGNKAKYCDKCGQAIEWGEGGE